MSIADLQKQMSDALAANDVGAIEAIALAIVKSKGERAKAEADEARIEAEQLAGKREELAKAIHASVKTLKLDGAIAELKAKGFVYTISHREDDKGRIDPNGAVKVTGGVALMVPVLKARKAGGGTTGKTKDEYGMSLSEVFEKFATSEDREKLAAAEAGEGRTDAKVWLVKTAVKKRAIADGLLQPAK